MEYKIEIKQTAIFHFLKILAFFNFLTKQAAKKYFGNSVLATAYINGEMIKEYTFNNSVTWLEK